MTQNVNRLQPNTISVVVLYYKDKDNIENCIKSILSQDYPLTELVLVDNNSGDGLCSQLKDRFPNIRLIEVPTNEGFCGGNNIGLAGASGEFVFFLNSDVILEPNYIGIVIRVFQSHPSVALVSGKILRFDRATIDSTGLFVTRNLTLTDRGADRQDKGQYDLPGPIFGCCGAVFGISREAVREVATDGQLFDETFFAFFEDGDASARVRASGKDVWYEPSAVAYHARGASSSGVANRRFWTKPRRYQFFAMRNRWFFVAKNVPAGILIKNLPRLLLVEGCIFVYAILHPSLLRAYYSFFRSLPRVLRARRRIGAVGRNRVWRDAIVWEPRS